MLAETGMSSCSSSSALNSSSPSSSEPSPLVTSPKLTGIQVVPSTVASVWTTSRLSRARLTNFTILVALFRSCNLEDLFKEWLFGGVVWMILVIEPIWHRLHRYFLKLLDVQTQLQNWWMLVFGRFDNHFENVDEKPNSLWSTC
jgi:hypothetical protein